MKIATKLYLVVLLPLVLLALVGTVLLRSNRIIDSEARREALVDEVTRGTFELNILAYEHLQRQTGRTKQQWQQKHARLTRTLESVDFPTPAERVTLSQARWTLEELNNIFADLLSAQETAPPTSPAVTKELKERLIGQLLAESQSLMSLTTTLSQSCDQTRARARRFSYWLTILFISITAGSVGVGVLLVTRGITQPILNLRYGAEQISSGHLDHKIGSAAEDEVGDLSRAFDSMAESLRQRITERDQALKALRLDEERLEALVKLNLMTNVTPQQIADFALEAAVSLTESKIGYLAFMNDDETVLTMHSWSKQAMAECAITDKPRIYPVASTGLWGEAVRQRKPVITNDYDAPNPLKKSYPDGHVPVRRHMNAPIFDGEHIVAVAGVGNKEAPYDEADVRQLTLLMQGMWRLVQRREAEEELRRHRDHLEELVADRTAELQATTAALARSNAELEQFAYIASHDLREPLRMITSFIQLLERGHRDKLDADGLRYIDFVVDGARRMEQLIKDLLQYARVGTHGKELVPVDCNSIVQTALQNLDIVIQENHAAIAVEGTLPTVRGDDVQLTQLFQNLIANAIKFHRPEEPPRVQIAARRNERDWVFSVCDNGIGIDPKYFERIFVIFQRLHARDKYPGTGIGLAVCKKIVERHGGRIWVESTPGQGATFYFALPS